MYEFSLVRGLAGATIMVLAVLGVHLVYERLRAWAVDHELEEAFMAAVFVLALVGFVVLFGVA